MNDNFVKFVAAAGAALAVNQAAAAPEPVVDREKNTVAEFVDMGNPGSGRQYAIRVLDCKYATVSMMGMSSRNPTMVDLLAAPASPSNTRRLAAFTKSCESHGLKPEF